MTAAWSHLRRLVASMMLVAVASFVLHAGALASLHRHAPAQVDCATAGHGHGTGHAHGAHGHAAHAASLHGGDAPGSPLAADLSADDPASDHHDHASGGDAPCCGKACAVALRAEPPAMTVQPVPSGRVLLATGQLGSGLGPSGLKRPPRPAGIA